MGNPALDQLIGQLFATVVPVAIFCIVIGSVLGVIARLVAKKRSSSRGERDGAPRRPLPKVILPQVRAEESSAAGEASLDTIGWETFELLAGELFRRQGYEVEITAGLGADGGKDVTLRRNGETRLVQCKNLRAGNKVAVGAMRDFYGLIVAEAVTGGIFMTTGTYSRDAREFAAGKPIELLERGDVEQLIASVTRPGENLCDVASWIDDFAAVARVADPTCPLCRKPMKLRRSPTGSAFWGCTGFPTHRCRGKRDVRTALVRARSYRPA